MITLNEETVEVLRTMDYGAQNVTNEICDLLRGKKAFSPVQAEALLELAKKKLMERAVLD